ncbi:MAG TPA: Gfo/Idh/MocA family oxidoreductase [Chloroflexota bacterium]|jgi:predicted dehydrogenase|nr:Gfo/Idh/MocA family oxidoreductase [Chloroflexota bacterium]
MREQNIMNEVRFGVIGAGYWGPHLIRNLTEIPGCKLAAIADLSTERLDNLRPRYPYTTMTTNVQDLVHGDVDAVVIATPVNTHFDLASQALRAGKHVLVEKPLTKSAREAQELIRLADENHVVLMVGHTFEYNPAVLALKEIVDSGIVGRVLYVDAARLNLGQYRTDVNVLWDLAPHDVSIMNYILGAEPTHVSARGNACINDGTHDVAYVELKYPNGVLGHIHVSWLEPCKVRRLTVVGDQKMVVYNDVSAEEKLRIYDKGVTKTTSSGDYADFQLSYHYGGVTIPAVPGGEPLKLELKHMIDCIRTGARPRSDGVSGLNVIKVLEAADKSLQNGGLRDRIKSFDQLAMLNPLGASGAEHFAAALAEDS